MTINELIEKYFAGETSIDEEIYLKEYFSANDIADDYLKYKPYFDYLAKESRVDINTLDFDRNVINRISGRDNFFKLNYKYFIAAAAAIFIMFIGVFYFGNYNVSNQTIIVTNENFEEHRELVINETSKALKIISENIAIAQSNVERINIVNEKINMINELNIFNINFEESITEN